jgi:hypothetical protein
VFPVRYELNLYILFRKKSSKSLMAKFAGLPLEINNNFKMKASK